MKRYSMRVAIHEPEHDGATGYYYVEAFVDPDGMFTLAKDAARYVIEHFRKRDAVILGQENPERLEEALLRVLSEQSRDRKDAHPAERRMAAQDDEA